MQRCIEREHLILFPHLNITDMSLTMKTSLLKLLMPLAESDHLYNSKSVHQSEVRINCVSQSERSITVLDVHVHDVHNS